MAGIERERIERVARLYATSQEASRALGITLRSFDRLCRRYGTETPSARRRRCRAQQPRRGGRDADGGSGC
jgi:hypothetical protein